MPKRSRTWGRAGILRAGLLSVALLLAGVLVLGSWRSYAVARSLARALTISQIDGYFHDLHAFAVARGRPGPEAIQDLYDAHKSDGLYYVGVFTRERTRIAEAGTDDANLPLPELDELQQVGDRVRLLVPAPPEGPGPEPPRGLPREGPATFLFELEPRLAKQLVADAWRGLLVSGAAAALLAGAAIVLWRLSAKIARIEVAQEEQRHLAVLGEMAAVLAHEIRNPLAIAKGHAQLLAEHPSGSDETRAWAGLVVDNAIRLEKLTADLLGFAKSGALERETVEPGTLLEEVARSVAPDRIRIDTKDAPAEWSIDPERMRQVLINLLDNAVHASPKEAEIEAVAFESAGRLVFEVRDRGPGVPEEARERIFEPFHTTRVQGTGLGLAVARRIAVLHGGALSVLDRPEGGAIFRVEIPMAEETEVSGGARAGRR